MTRARRLHPLRHTVATALLVAAAALALPPAAGAQPAPAFPDAPRPHAVQAPQDPRDPRDPGGPGDGPRMIPVPRSRPTMAQYYDRQLAQIDQLIRLGYHSRAHALLEELAKAGASEDEVRRRRITIALAVGEHDRAVDLAREALAADRSDPVLWRELAAALAQRGDLADARDALDRFLGLVSRRDGGGFATAVDILQAAGDHTGAVALVDSARTVLGDPGFLARPRALALLALDRPEEAAREAVADLTASPFNLQLLRRDLLAEDAPPLPPAFGDALLDLAGRPQVGAEVAVLAANVALVRGDAATARGLVLPRLDDTDAARAALHNAGTLARELPLIAGAREQQAVVDYLVAVLPELARHPRLTVRLHQRALEALAETCVQALQNDRLGPDPAAAADRFGELLALVRAGHPEAPELYAAQIALARYERDRLRRPLAAASRLEAMLLDLDLPLEGVALARLVLGESYLAARDTARARQVLTALGRDTEFRAPAGHAHFLLARLDLAQGHLGTARDRFAAVALDNPAAPYANDALELGLVVAEELQNPTGGPDLLLRYARSVWWDLAAEPDSQRVALERYVGRAAVQVDLDEPQPLLERARLELARLERGRGRTDAALAQLERIVLDQPDGRLAPRALALRGEILATERGDAASARREYERLLVQYPDYLFATEIRQRLRELP